MGAETPFREIVARPAQHQISAVPVVDHDQGVEGVVRVENRLAYDLDDRGADRVLAFHVFDP